MSALAKLPPGTVRAAAVAEAPAGGYRSRVPLAQAAAQAAATLVALALRALLAAAAEDGNAMTWALLQGVVAASLGRLRLSVACRDG